MNLQQFHLSNREARSVARSARTHNLDRGLRQYESRSFAEFMRDFNRTHEAVTH